MSPIEWITGIDQWLLVIWVYALPIVIVYASIRWVIDKFNNK